MFQTWSPDEYERFWRRIWGVMTFIVLSASFYFILLVISDLIFGIVFGKTIYWVAYHSFLIAVSVLIIFILKYMMYYGLWQHPLIYWWVILLGHRIDYKPLETKIVKVIVDSDPKSASNSGFRFRKWNSDSDKQTAIKKFMTDGGVGLFYIKDEGFRYKGEHCKPSVFFASGKNITAFVLSLPELAKEDDY